MRDGWTTTKLGDVITRRTDFTPVDADEDYTILGVQRSGWGFMEREPMKGSAQKFTKLMQVEQDDLVYRTITAFEAPSGVVGPAESGKFVTPQTFPVFRINSARLLPAYMRLLTTWPVFHEAMASRCTGSVLRRKTLSISSFESIPVDLPSIEEQRRIVDLLAAVDSTIEATIAAREASGAQIEQLSYQVLPALGTGKTPLSDTFSRSIGGVWGQPAGEGDIDVVAFRSTEFSDWGHVIHKEPAVRSITQREYTTRALKPGDILVEKSGGTPTRPVGRVVQFYRHDLQAPSIGTNFMQIVRPDPAKIAPRYAYWLLWANHRRGGSVLHQKASTNIRNLQTKAYLQQSVVLPTRAEQEQTAALLDSVLNVRRSTDQQLESLRDLRSNLLSALLSGEHEIPKPNDDIMELAS